VITLAAKLCGAALKVRLSLSLSLSLINSSPLSLSACTPLVCWLWPQNIMASHTSHGNLCTNDELSANFHSWIKAGMKQTTDSQPTRCNR